jgi:hypothetical protein
VGLLPPKRQTKRKTSALNEAVAKVTAVEKSTEKISSWSIVPQKN